MIGECKLTLFVLLQLPNRNFMQMRKEQKDKFVLLIEKYFAFAFFGIKIQKFIQILFKNLIVSWCFSEFI